MMFRNLTQRPHLIRPLRAHPLVGIMLHEGGDVSDPDKTCQVAPRFLHSAQRSIRLTLLSLIENRSASSRAVAPAR